SASAQGVALPALLNSLAQLEFVAGDFESAKEHFDEVATQVAGSEQAVAHHNAHHAALELRDWPEALAALERATALDADLAPFPRELYEPQRILGAGGFGVSFLCRDVESGETVVVKALRLDALDREVSQVFEELDWLDKLDP